MSCPRPAFLALPLPLNCFRRQVCNNNINKRKVSVFNPRIKMASTTTEERFDVLKDDGTHVGYSKPRSKVHRDGDWHRSTHIWVVTNDARVLVQKRAVGKDTFPVS